MEEDDATSNGDSRGPYNGPERRRAVPVGPERRHGVNIDLTLNIPTLLTMLALIVSTSAAGISAWNSLDKRQMSTEFAVNALTVRIDKAENSVAALKSEQGAQFAALRSEMKGDLNEIKGQLDRLVYSGPPPVARRQLNDQWSK